MLGFLANFPLKVYSDWIPGYLHPDTQTALMDEMAEAVSKSDKPGYIYGFEIKGARYCLLTVSNH